MTGHQYKIVPGPIVPIEDICPTIDTDELLAVAVEMEERKVNGGQGTSSALWAWASRIRTAIGEPRT